MGSAKSKGQPVQCPSSTRNRKDKKKSKKNEKLESHVLVSFTIFVFIEAAPPAAWRHGKALASEANK